MKNYCEIVALISSIYRDFGNNYIHECHMTGVMSC